MRVMALASSLIGTEFEFDPNKDFKASLKHNRRLFFVVLSSSG